MVLYLHQYSLLLSDRLKRNKALFLNKWWKWWSRIIGRFGSPPLGTKSRFHGVFQKNGQNVQPNGEFHLTNLNWNLSPQPHILKVCDGRGDPCDSRCGGGGCGKCGGVSCDQGAATKSENAIDLAERADALLMEKQQIVSQMLRSVSFIDFIKPMKASKHEFSQNHWWILGEGPNEKIWPTDRLASLTLRFSALSPVWEIMDPPLQTLFRKKLKLYTVSWSISWVMSVRPAKLRYGVLNS